MPSLLSSSIVHRYTHTLKYFYVRVSVAARTLYVCSPDWSVWSTLYRRQYDESTCRSRDTVRCSLALARLVNWPMKTVVTNDHEAQTFLEQHWTKWLPPFWLYPILYVNAWVEDRTQTCLPSFFDVFIFFVCVALIRANLLPTGKLHPFVTVIDRIMHTNFKSKCYSLPLCSMLAKPCILLCNHVLPWIGTSFS